VGDRALLRRFDHRALADANRAAVACARELLALEADEIEDVVPGARTVLVTLRPGAEPSHGVVELLGTSSVPPANDEPGRLVEIPARYGGEDGPDLEEVAAISGLDSGRVVGAHTSVEYTVGFVGFSPGFAYLLGLDRTIEVPRLDTPRPRVPPGSIGIGGAYTGVYPRPTAGGWRLIGRTDVDLFEPSRDPPALLRPGDRVRFSPR
jgi:KipI family sensor histidine kinase inhibitor